MTGIYVTLSCPACAWQWDGAWSGGTVAEIGAELERHVTEKHPPDPGGYVHQPQGAVADRHAVPPQHQLEDVAEMMNLVADEPEKS